jgi:hypothetical protein
MTQRHAAGSVAGQDQYIEPILVPCPAAPQDPRPGRPFKCPALPRPDSLLAGPETIRAPSLDLDERHQRPLAGDQVEVMAAHAESVRLNVPAPAHEPASGGELCLPSVAVTRVGPFGGGNAVGRHASRKTPSRPSVRVGTTHRGAFERGTSSADLTATDPRRNATRHEPRGTREESEIPAGTRGESGLRSVLGQEASVHEQVALRTGECLQVTPSAANLYHDVARDRRNLRRGEGHVAATGDKHLR